MQLSACSETAQPFESARRNSSSHSPGREAARVRSRKRTPSGVISKWRPTWREPPRTGDRRHRPAGPFEAARHRPGVAEVLAHQRLDPLLRLPAARAEDLGDALLQIVAEHVDVAPGLEVEHRPGPLQEVLGLEQLARAAVGLAVERRRLRAPGCGGTAAMSRSPPGALLMSGSSW